MFDEIKNIKSTKKELKSFGLTIGIIFLVIGGFLFFKEKDFYQIFIYFAGGLIGFGYLIPIILKPIYIIWMVFAVILGWIMNRVILMLLFYILITPIGILARVFGKDFLELNKPDKYTYWNYRNSDIELNQDYEKQF